MKNIKQQIETALLKQNSMKHTQGEWKIKINGLQTELHIVSQDDFDIAVVPFAWRKSEINEANAKLIAAAPDLLEALKIAIQYMKVFMIRGEEPLVGENLEVDLNKAQTAIKKATT